MLDQWYNVNYIHVKSTWTLYRRLFATLIIHEKNTIEIIDVKESLYVIKHVDFHKTFEPILSAYTTYIYTPWTFFRKQNDNMGIK